MLKQSQEWDSGGLQAYWLANRYHGTFYAHEAMYVVHVG
jgi:hypothetical protein